MAPAEDAEEVVRGDEGVQGADFTRGADVMEVEEQDGHRGAWKWESLGWGGGEVRLGGMAWLCVLAAGAGMEGWRLVQGPTRRPILPCGQSRKQ